MLVGWEIMSNLCSSDTARCVAWRTRRTLEKDRRRSQSQIAVDFINNSPSDSRRLLHFPSRSTCILLDSQTFTLLRERPKEFKSKPIREAETEVLTSWKNGVRHVQREKESDANWLGRPDIAAFESRGHVPPLPSTFVSETVFS